MKLPGHPSTHGHDQNPHTCGSQLHAFCDGFSGGYDTYQCGCCCHDLDWWSDLPDGDRTLLEGIVARSRAGGGS